MLFLLAFSYKYMVCLPFGVKKLELVVVLDVKVELRIRLLRHHSILESDTLHSVCLIVPCQREIQSRGNKHYMQKCFSLNIKNTEW